MNKDIIAIFAIEMLTHFLVSQNEATKNNKTQ